MESINKKIDIKKRTIFFIIFVIFSICLSLYCNIRHLPKKIIYRPPGTRVEYYSLKPEKLKLTIYPSSTRIHRGAVLFIHGGAWRIGGPDMPLFYDWEVPLKNARLRAFSIEHRLAPKYQGHDLIDDCISALFYIKKNAHRFRIPADKIALIGFSSGGHLAVMTGLHLSRPGDNNSNDKNRTISVRAIAAFYSPMDLGSFYVSGNRDIRRVILDFLPEKCKRYMLLPFFDCDFWFHRELLRFSPIEHIHKKMPPIMLLHGRRDKVVPISQSMAFLIKSEKVVPGRVKLEKVKRGRHNFNTSRRKWARRAENHAIKFILNNM